MKLVLALPWYAGPDETTYPQYFDFMMYLGAMRERSLWFERLGADLFSAAKLTPLNEGRPDSGNAEPSLDEWLKLSPLQIAVANYSRTSLVGRAREEVVQSALEWDADWIFWWDSDILFDYSVFLDLWRHQKQVVAALAFTARHPIAPVIYRIVHTQDQVVSSDPVLDYPRGRLIGDAEVDGSLAFGAGVMLTHASVFRELSKPWFASTSCGEDWFFCWRCASNGIPRFVDTKVRTQHKLHMPRWADESAFDKELQLLPDAYKKVYDKDLYKRALKASKEASK